MSAQAMTVRPARAEDAEGLWPLARDFATSFTPTRAAFDTTLPLLLARDDTLLLVAPAGGDVTAGYLLASTHLTFLADGPVAWVKELMVRADRRGQGIGTALMDGVEDWAWARGAAYVALASRRAGDFSLARG